MNAMKWIFKYIKKIQIKLIVGLIFVTITSLLAIINPKITGKIVDEVIGNGKNINLDLLPKLLIIMILTALLRSLLRLVFLFLFETSSQTLLYDLREEVYVNLLQKDFAFYNKNRTGDLMSRQTGDMMAIRHFVAHVIYNIYENVLLFCIALVMIFTIDYRIALGMVSVLPITAFMAYLQSKAVKPAFGNVRSKFSSLNAFAQENISGNRVIKAFAKEDYEIEKFDFENDGYKDAEINAAKIWIKYVPIFEFLSNLLVFILLLVGGFMVIKGNMSLGELTAISGYLWMLNNPLRFAGWLINDVFRFTTSVEKIYSTIQIQPDVKQPENAIEVSKLKGDIEFKNVSYQAEDDVILKDINFKVKSGQKVGIIGPTGSGKSTIMNLLCRFFDVTSGEILIDGINIKDYDLYRLRDNIGMAMQDVFLFSDTIEGNIAYGVPDCDFEKVKWAAKIADADGFISKMPEGYDTIVGERGVGLSGGQKQRISLARAIIKQPTIIILDDTTSAVDMETETQIHSSLESLENKETVFIIAHRISSIKDADVIIVLDDGKITEAGTHEELLANKKDYYRVFNHQYGEFDKLIKKKGDL